MTVAVGQVVGQGVVETVVVVVGKYVGYWANEVLEGSVEEAGENEEGQRTVDRGVQLSRGSGNSSWLVMFLYPTVQWRKRWIGILSFAFRTVN